MTAPPILATAARTVAAEWRARTATPLLRAAHVKELGSVFADMLDALAAAAACTDCGSTTDVRDVLWDGRRAPLCAECRTINGLDPA